MTLLLETRHFVTRSLFRAYVMADISQHISIFLTITDTE
jgi:hypothetical protein